MSFRNSLTLACMLCSACLYSCVEIFLGTLSSQEKSSRRAPRLHLSIAMEMPQPSLKGDHLNEKVWNHQTLLRHLLFLLTKPFIFAISYLHICELQLPSLTLPTIGSFSWAPEMFRRGSTRSLQRTAWVRSQVLCCAVAMTAGSSGGRNALLKSSSLGGSDLGGSYLGWS